MKILNEITPIFDITGHFYMGLNNNIFELSVNNKNELEIYKIYNNDNFQYEILDISNFNIGNLNLLSNSSSLKSKVIREYIKDKSENPDEEYESDEELDKSTIDDINNKMTYYPEDLEIENESIDNDNDDDLDKFNFYGKIETKCLQEVTNNDIYYENDYEQSDIISAYDTFLYKGDENDNELVFVSKNSKLNSGYRIVIYENGTICFKIIGSYKKILKLVINNDNDNISFCSS
jgi:hypothetical protein